MADLLDIVATNTRTRLRHLGATPYAAAVGCRLRPAWLSTVLHQMEQGRDITLYTLDQIAIILGEQPEVLIVEVYDPAASPPPPWCRQ